MRLSRLKDKLQKTYTPKQKTLLAACALLRYYILLSTTTAGSGHPSSCLSSVELMATLFFGGLFKYDSDNPAYPNNDRVIFSKGHAAPLLYSLWTLTGVISERKLKTLRSFGSDLEGHPTRSFAYVDGATGSLGQGLSIGVGRALAGKIDKLDYTTYVLLGDSELAEGSNWEAAQLAAHYKLDNLVAIVDVNRLGQRGETMTGKRTDIILSQFLAFGWQGEIVDGHNTDQILQAYQRSQNYPGPYVIVAKTIKGKGVSIMEDKNGWHSKVLTKKQYEKALEDLAPLKKKLNVSLPKPNHKRVTPLATRRSKGKLEFISPMGTRKIYGKALAQLVDRHHPIIALDAEVSNSTYVKDFQQVYPERFFEMFIAEQNMVGVATGLALAGKKPCISTFGAFFTRAHDQLRMASYNKVNISCVGTHVGVSMGADGVSQMGLEDIALFRSLWDSIVLYPSDCVSTAKLLKVSADYGGVSYLRLSRPEVPLLYSDDEEFVLGGSKILAQSEFDQVAIVAAGVTVHAALQAHHKLAAVGIRVRIIDLYSIKPLDEQTLVQTIQSIPQMIIAEDHYAQGGIGEAVMSCLSGYGGKIMHICVAKLPRSGSPEDLMEYEEIDSAAIVKQVNAMIKKNPRT